MEKLRRNWRIEVLHHSHTDIGYTDRQELICRYHADYLRQALNILRRIEAGEAEEQKGFCWQCENYWQVERFFEEATEEEKEAFLDYVRQGRIDLDGYQLYQASQGNTSVLDQFMTASEVFDSRRPTPVVANGEV